MPNKVQPNSKIQKCVRYLKANPGLTNDIYRLEFEKLGVKKRDTSVYLHKAKQLRDKELKLEHFVL